jgi:acetyltransferase-like isoleucine patch superfamily enzyme
VKAKQKIIDNEYIAVSYGAFTRSAFVRKIRKLFVYLLLPVLIPFIIPSRVSSIMFRTSSELLSLIPFVFGVIIRESFYSWTLESCGDNITIGFCTVFVFNNISIGSNVLIGSNCTINHCDFGNNVMVSTGCRLLSGSRQHDFARTDIPMTEQNGYMKKIKIGNDVWVGTNCVIMEDLADGSIVAAGSVVNKKTEPYTINGGNPSRQLKMRQ